MADMDLLLEMVSSDYTFDTSIERKFSISDIKKVARKYTIDELAQIKEESSLQVERLKQEIALIEESLQAVNSIVEEKETMETHNVAFVEKCVVGIQNSKTGRLNFKRGFKISVVETSEDEQSPKKIVYQKSYNIIGRIAMGDIIKNVSQDKDFKKVVFVDIESPTVIKEQFEVIEITEEEYSSYDICANEGVETINKDFRIKNEYIVPRN